jgi:hypothetical protein
MPVSDSSCASAAAATGAHSIQEVRASDSGFPALLIKEPIDRSFAQVIDYFPIITTCLEANAQDAASSDGADPLVGSLPRMPEFERTVAFR